MGKRSDFKRVERDFYPTPEAAVLPLLDHLEYDATYIEPCAGDGALIDVLDRMLNLLMAYDIEPKRPGILPRDALEYCPRLGVCWPDYFITNPPWDRKILHPLIEHLSDIAPTWLLFDADWVHTKQSAPFMPRLRKIVSVGRVKWIPDSKMTGKDNCAWHLFDKPSDDPTLFYGRGNQTDKFTPEGKQ